MMGLENHKPLLVMLGCQFIYTGLTLSSRAALLQDLSTRVFVAYRQYAAFLLIAPVVYFSRRGTQGCSLSWKSFWLISLLSLIGVTVSQNVYFEGLYLASSAASALGNLVPGVTFLLAYLTGLEKVHLRSSASWAKIIGTALCVGGAVVMAIVKGPKLFNIDQISPKNSSLLLKLVGQHDAWIIGCLLLVSSTFCWSIFLILQVKVSACYPDHLSLTAWMCLIAAVQSTVVTLIIEPDMNAWKLTSPLQLFACIYAGLAAALTLFAVTWVVARRGPLFSAMFNPLATVIVTLLATIFMHEDLYIGSLVGGLAVIGGLYVVLWGKSRELEESKTEESSQMKQQNNDLEQPLLSEN